MSVNEALINGQMIPLENKTQPSEVVMNNTDENKPYNP